MRRSAVLPPLPLSWRLARRELRGGLKGFRIFLLCLMLGVAAIAAVGSVAAAVRAGIAADGRALLGGDVELRLLYRPASAEQIAFLRAAGTLSETREMRAMARTAGGEAALVELKAADAAYPLYGRLRLDPALAPAALFGHAEGAWGAAAGPDLLERLGVGLGGRLRIGDAEYELRALILEEPDRGTDLFTLGPRLMVGLEGLAASGLEQPGSLIYHHYRLRFAAPQAVEPWLDSLAAAFPDAGWRIRSLDNAAPALERFVDRTALFLTLVGLSALLVGGVGVGNAVRSYLETKTATIATLKCLGAPAGLIQRTYMALVLLLAGGGTLLGLALGALAPAAAGAGLARHLAVELPWRLYPLPLAVAAVFGLLIAIAFSLWPLARARAVPAGSLFRDLVARARPRPALRDLAAMAGVGLLLTGLAVLTATDREVAAGFVLGAGLALLAFRGAAWLVMRAAARLNRQAIEAGRPPILRLALANLHRPGAATGSVVLSLGLGLTLLVAVALIEGNLARQIRETLPEAAPAFFFIDIQPDQAEPFERLVAAQPGVARIERVPMLRGRLTHLAGRPVEQVAVPADMRWVLQGDRGVTWAARPPRGTRIVAGAWWPEDYRGPPLVSLDAHVAEQFGLAVGDSIGINVLGRAFTATIASLRELDWASLGINFVMIFSPGFLEGAPQTHIATVHAAPEAEAALQRAVTDRFANISAIRVREALDSVNRVLGAIGAAIRATGAVTLLAGLLVLAGAVAAGHRRRVYDAVVLKVLGATRRDIAHAFLLEYGLLGLVTGAIAALLGTLAGWFVVTAVLDTPWTFLPGAVAATAALGAALTLTFGLAGTWRALGGKAAPLLRNE